MTGLDKVKKALAPLFIMGMFAGIPETTHADEHTLSEATERIPTPSEEYTEVTNQLQENWSQQRAVITARISHLNERQKAVNDALKRNNMQPSAEKFGKEWNEITKRIQDDHGMGTNDLSKYGNAMKSMEKILKQWEQWDRLKIGVENDEPSFHERYLSILKERSSLEMRHQTLLMTDEDGYVLSLYPEEKAADPTLTHDEYLQELADIVDTPEKLAMFLEYYMEYVHDTTDAAHPLQEGTDEDHGDYWQSLEETLTRVRAGRMLGDCEDQGKLAAEIISLWGKKVIPLLIPGHYTCVRIDKDPFTGKYRAWDIGTFGLDCNGTRFNRTETGGYRVGPRYWFGPPKADVGYDTPQEALHSVMEKFRRCPEMKNSMEGWQPDPMEIPTDNVFIDPDNSTMRQCSTVNVPLSKLGEFVNEETTSAMRLPEDETRTAGVMP